jgi:signal transduction histidine kinase
MVTTDWFRKQAAMSIVQLGLLFAISAPVAIAIWVASRRRPPPAASLDATPDEMRESSPNGIGLSAETLDVEHAVREVANASHSAAHAQFVQIELAVHSDIKVRADPNALRVALETAMRIAIRATPGGQVLVTSERLGRQMRIRIVDDGMAADQGSRESLLHEVETLIALQGGSIVVEAIPGRGTSVTLRLPMPSGVSEEVTYSEEVSALARQAA